MSMRGGKFYRPMGASAGDDDDDDDDDDEEEESSDEEEVGGKSNSGGGPGGGTTGGGGNDDDDDDDADSFIDDDDEESDDVGRSKKRKADSKRGGKDSGGGGKKKSKVSFFDEEAVSDGDEDGGDDEVYGQHYDPHDRVKRHYTEEDIQREQMDDEAREIMRMQDRRRQQAGRFNDFEEMSAQEMARQIEMRHRMTRRTVHRSNMMEDDMMGGHGGAESQFSAVSQQSLVPSVSDPSMWMFKCIPGKEQELVIQILNKCKSLALRGKPVGITSAIAAQSKGLIYIESFNEPSVVEIVQGVRQLMSYSMRLVPINDMTTVMTVVPSKRPVKKNDWVRMTRGHHKGDLALVIDVKDGGLKAVIQCVPRLDLTLSTLNADEARIRRRTVRPPQKFFSASEVRALGKHTQRQRFPGGTENCDYFEGNYYHDGYLLKEVTVGTMIKSCTDEDPPSLDELQRFRKRKKTSADGYDDGAEDDNEGSRMANSLLDELSELQGKTGLSSGAAGGTGSSSSRGLIIGDTVEVIEGDLIGLRGKLLSVDGSTVKVQPTTELAMDMNEIEFLTSQLRKFIPVGAHVKVTEGRYSGETGVVVAIEPLQGEPDCSAIVMTDMTHKEISVRTSQLQESTEIASGQDKLEGYELHDLVEMSGSGSMNSDVGVIVRVGREEFSILNNHGIVREVRPEELRGKRNFASQKAVALDAQGNQIRCGDTVNIIEGTNKGRNATIKRMRRAQLFLYSQTRTDNAGIFVIRSRSCVLAGASVRNRGRNNAMQDQRKGAAGGAGGRGSRDDAMMGKTVRIRAGQWKGYLGVVTDTTPNKVQVELHSRLKKVMVLKDKVIVAGDKFGATEDPTTRGTSGSGGKGGMSNGGGGLIGGTTPYIGGQTPMHGGATPMHGGATPMHAGGAGGYTPSHSGGMDGGESDVWRPGGEIDQTSPEDGNDGGWGAVSSSTNDNPWGSSTSNGKTNDDGGLDSKDDNTWGAAAAGTGNGIDSSADTPWGASAATAVTTDNDTGATMGGGAGATTTTDNDPTAVDGGGNIGETPVWFMERVCVEVRAGHPKAGMMGVIKEIKGNGNTADIELDNNTDGNTVVLRANDVTLVQPKEHDMVLVTGGADVGVEGELVCIDGNDAILKDPNEEFKIVDLIHLAKINEQTQY